MGDVLERMYVDKAVKAVPRKYDRWRICLIKDAQIKKWKGLMEIGGFYRARRTRCLGRRPAQRRDGMTYKFQHHSRPISTLSLFLHGYLFLPSQGMSHFPPRLILCSPRSSIPKFLLSAVDQLGPTPPRPLREKVSRSLFWKHRNSQGSKTILPTKSIRLTCNRYHIGESLIPSVRHYLRFIGAEDKLTSYGFVRKVGG
jgi:hypothetical protein